MISQILRIGVLALLAWPQVIQAQIRAPSTVKPGDPVVVTMLGGEPFEVALIRLENGSVVARAQSFSIAVTALVQLRSAILGVATTVQPGDYELELRMATGGPIVKRHLSISYREFDREEIALTTTLADLRERHDPRKVDQALMLQRVVGEFNPGSIYHPGPFSWPIPLTRRISLFGDRRIYLYEGGERAPAIHNGLDLASPTGTPVVASGLGRVRMATDRIVTGNTIVIEHLPGVFSLYYHLDEIAVTQGEVVHEGELIGTVGATGLATGPHLHWEFRIGGIPVDPEAMLQGLLVDIDR